MLKAAECEAWYAVQHRCDANMIGVRYQMCKQLRCGGLRVPVSGKCAGSDALQPKGRGKGRGMSRGVARGIARGIARGVARGRCKGNSKSRGKGRGRGRWQVVPR